MNPFELTLWRVRTTRQQLATAESRSRNSTGRAVLELGISGLVPTGLKGISRRTLSSLSAGQRQVAERKDQELVDQLVSEARGLASHHSIPTTALAPGGNSHRLLGRLGASLDSGSAVARVVKLERALDGLARIDLIENSTIAQVLSAREYAKSSARVLAANPELSTLGQAGSPAQSLDSLRTAFANLSFGAPVSEPLEGALISLERGGPDSYRQGLNSLRVALDSLIEVRGGKGDWKTVGKTLTRSDEEWRIVTSYHHFLSMGSHHGRAHSASELQLGLQLFAPVAALLTRI